MNFTQFYLEFKIFSLFTTSSNLQSITLQIECKSPISLKPNISIELNEFNSLILDNKMSIQY